MHPARTISPTLAARPIESVPPIHAPDRDGVNEFDWLALRSNQAEFGAHCGNQLLPIHVCRLAIRIS